VAYEIEDVPSLDIESSKSLDGLDSTQSTLMSEAVILVDESDNVVGSAAKADSHHKAGQLHRAFSVLLFDSDRRLLLQKRADHKITFPGVWANTCCSHPLYSEEEMEEDNAVGVKRAAIRKMEHELGISPDNLPIESFNFITKMMYSARMNADWIEREIDHILIIHADVELDPNPNEVSEICWVNIDELEDMLVSDEQIIAPWFRCIASRIMTPDWWSPEGIESDDLIHDMGDVSHMLPGAIGSDLSTAMAEIRPLLESRIVSAFKQIEHERLSDAMLHLIMGGGKRLRACLPWLVAKAVGDTHASILDIGAAIETIHNFTLVHDDIMDNDDIRRGRNAVHIEYDTPTAINAGDAMMATAFEMIGGAENIESKYLHSIVQRIAWMVRKVSEGQQLDIEFENRDLVSEEEYLKMINGKTAVMFQVCSEVGALLSGADEDTVECMRDWGHSVGMCFQLMDDLIDISADSASIGKPVGSDIAQGKQTLIAIHALNQPDSSSKQTFLSAFGSPDTDVEIIQHAISALEELGSIDYAMSKAKSYHRAAHSLLDRIPDSPAMSTLRELTDYQLTRLS